MSSYETLIFEQLGLHHLKLPNRLVTPMQVQIRDHGQTFGRFALDQVFDGDFANVRLGETGDIANIDQTLSAGYEVGGGGSMSGLLGLVKKFAVRFESKGAERVRITGLGGTLVEVNQGDLLLALNNAFARDDGPLNRSRVALVILAVASVKEFAIELETKLGAEIKADAELVEMMKGEASLSADLGRSGGLKITSADPIPFAVRLWTVKKPWIGEGLKISSAKGPLDVLGEGDASGSFREDAGIVENVVDLD